MIPGNFTFTCADTSVYLYIKLFVMHIAYQGCLFFFDRQADLIYLYLYC
jgi:hypothetical protein